MEEPENDSRLSRAYGVWVVRLRWLVVAAVAAAAILATMHLPGLQSDAGLEVAQQNSPAVQSEQRVLETFGLPLLSLAALVQHDPDGLDTAALGRAARRATQVNLKTFNEGLPATGIAGALPIPNAVPVPFRPTTIVTYLWGGSTLNSAELVQAARQYGEELGPPGDVVGVTGVVPVQVEQGLVVKSRLEMVEIATLLAVALILAISCRSLVAPVITLASAVVAYAVTIRLIGAAAAQLEISAPSQLEPLVVALTLGLATDYAILFVTGMRYRTSLGWQHRDALRSAITHNVPIVMVAGLIVTAGVGSISVAELPLFRAFGPGLAIVVAVTLLVSITLVPALLAIFGRFALWPGAPRRSDAERRSALKSERFGRMMAKRPVAAIAVVVSLAALLAAGHPLTEFRPAVSSPDTLPAGNEVRMAADAAAEGFPPGVLAPTEILVEQPGITDDRTELVALQRRLAAQPGVAAVVGPRQQPVDVSVNGAGLFLAPNGDAARYLVIFDNPGLSATGLQSLIDLQQQMPAFQQETGLQEARVEYIGAGALGAEFVSTARSDFIRVGIAVGLVNLILLMVFLRAVVAPFYLLACSYLSVGAALGLTTLVFQQGAGYDGLIFYAPFAAAVLLISLGSDYNVFTVGQIWDEARSHSLREAVAVGLPRSARPVTIAGLALATSFAFVGLIPVAPFQQLAFAVAVGVLIDTFLVRSLLVPGLIVLIGRVSGWPGTRLATHRGPYHDRQIG